MATIFISALKWRSLLGFLLLLLAALIIAGNSFTKGHFDSVYFDPGQMLFGMHLSENQGNSC